MNMVDDKHIFIPFWTVIVNGGDGSAYAKYFSTEQLAKEYMEEDNERFCDDIIPPGKRELNSRRAAY